MRLSVSSEVCPEVREYERFSTTCANAYVQPLMARYLENLKALAKQSGFDCPILLMTSGGGLTTLETAVRFPIRLVESGPAGGVILSTQIAANMGIDRILSFDMGGTTAKICIIDDGKPMASRSFEVDRRYRFMKGSGPAGAHPRDRDGRDRRGRRLAGQRRRHEAHQRRPRERRLRSRPGLLLAAAAPVPP